MDAVATQDLAVAGLVVSLALVAFIAVLWLNRDSSGKKGKDGGAQGGEAAGTLFTEEGGKLVRRSTRTRKSVVAEEALLASPVKVEPKSPRAVKTPAKTPVKTPAKAPVAAAVPAVAKTPTAERMVSPGRGRRGGPKPQTPIAATPDTAIRDAISPSRRRGRRAAA